MFKNVLIVSAILMSILSLEVKGQDYHFSQFYIAPLTLNPALTGLKSTDLRATANYRRQWSSISEPFQTVSVSADYNILNGNIGDNLMGVGLLIFNDKAGSAGLSRTKIAMTGAYSQNIIEGSYISIGFEAGVINQRISPKKLMFENQYDGEGLNSDIPHNENFSNTSQWDYDLAIGLAWSYAPDAYTSVYLGGSISHLNRPDLSFLQDNTDELERKVTLYGGAEFRLNGYLSLVP
ncbi:MAG: PorP/SprF family type IX secretion system membrane protein, partial [Saprospiraceae bacterium]